MAKLTEHKRAQLLQGYKGRSLAFADSIIFNLDHAEKHADELIGTDYEERVERNYGDEAAALRELKTEMEEIKARLKELILA